MIFASEMVFWALTFSLSGYQHRNVSRQCGVLFLSLSGLQIRRHALFDQRVVFSFWRFVFWDMGFHRLLVLAGGGFQHGVLHLQICPSWSHSLDIRVFWCPSSFLCPEGLQGPGVAGSGVCGEDTSAAVTWIWGLCGTKCQLWPVVLHQESKSLPITCLGRLVGGHEVEDILSSLLHLPLTLSFSETAVLFSVPFPSSAKVSVSPWTLGMVKSRGSVGASWDAEVSFVVPTESVGFLRLGICWDGVAVGFVEAVFGSFCSFTFLLGL